MDNTINFTGLRNLGVLNVTTKNMRAGAKTFEEQYFIARLTDDAQGKDFKEFRDVVFRCMPHIPECLFPYNPSYLHIITSDCSKGSKLFVNLNEIPVKRETIPMFSYLAKLTKKIMKKPENELLVSDDFKYGIQGDKFILAHNKLSSLVTDERDRIFVLNNIYSSDNVKAGAEIINNFIQRVMENYLM